MSLPLANDIYGFFAEIGAESSVNSNIDEDITIVGRPYHLSKESLINRYLSSTKEFLSHEARHSCGNYILIDTRDDEITAITSPGYAGGYFVDQDNRLCIASSLYSALQSMPINDIGINPNIFKYHISNDIKTRLPFTTIFEDIYRLPPGIHFQGDCSEWEMKSNLVTNRSDVGFEQACTEISDALAEPNVSVCLSGGADSAALAGILLKNDIDFDTAIFDWGPGQADAIERAPIIANEFGIDYNIYEINRPLTESQVPYIEQKMRRDIIKPYPPTLQFDEDYGDERIFIYGFYPDVPCWPKMKNQYSYESMVGESPKRIAGKILRLLPNLQYTHHYIENESMRRAYLALVPSLVDAVNPLITKRLGKLFPERQYNLGYYRENEKYSFSPTREAIYNGILTTGRISVQTDSLSFEYLSDDTESRILQDYSHEDVFENAEIFCRLNKSISNIVDIKKFTYYINMQNTHKQLTSFPTPSGDQVEIPMDWGPSISYFLNNENDLHRAMYPKPEVYEIVKSLTGVPYHELTGDVESSDYGVNWEKPKGEPLIEQNQHLLSPNNSRVLELFEGQGCESFTEVYQWASDMATQNEYEHPYESQQLIRLLNIEMILESVFE